MSIEFSAPIESEMPRDTQTGVVACLCSRSDYQVVREAGPEYGLAPIASSTNQSIKETITIIFNASSIYVAFHFATRAMRESFLRLLQNALAEVNIVSEFEEI